MVNGQRSQKPGDRPRRQSKVWSDKKFARFMGRSQQYEARMAADKNEQGGDNG